MTDDRLRRLTSTPNSSYSVLRRPSSDLRRARRRHREHGVQRFGIARIAQLVGNVGVAQETGDTRQRLEVICAGAFRCEQKEDEIDPLAVERFEIDRAVEPRKQAEQLVQLGELAVRYRYPVADAGRAELLALQQGLED